MLTNKTGTKWEILEYLRESGEATISDLENEIGVSPSTLNEHLSDLQAMDLLQKRSERDGPGRPHYLYSLTDNAEHLFPHSYAKLATLLLEVIHSMDDSPEARRKIINLLKRHVEAEDDLKKALQTLGFYPEFENDDNESEKVIYHQCPFYEVAKNDNSLCEIDAKVLEEVTDKDVEMDGCIVQGQKRCEFILTEN